MTHYRCKVGVTRQAVLQLCSESTAILESGAWRSSGSPSASPADPGPETKSCPQLQLSQYEEAIIRVDEAALLFNIVASLIERSALLSRSVVLVRIGN